MKLSTKQITEIILISIFFILTVFFFIPWEVNEVSFEIKRISTDEPYVNDFDFSDTADTAEPWKIAELFGYREPVRIIRNELPVNTEKTETGVQEASWLKYVRGYIDDYYFFMNNKTGRPLRLTLGNTAAGYTLLKIFDDKFLIEYNDMEYYVYKR